jgi:bifunctional enzyme CysN/CysC
VGDQRDLLRFLLCGSADDGKSTLIGRLLSGSRSPSADQVGPLQADSAKHGAQGEERDVGYRQFSTQRRHFIVVDSPGHEQYMRSMVTGAATADCAVVVVDALQGFLTETRKHSYLVSLLGLHHVVVAVNKIDAVHHDESTFRAIEREYLEFAVRVGLEDVTCIPVSALNGDNVLEPSDKLKWFDGPTLIGYLGAVEAQQPTAPGDFRMPVVRVDHASSDFQGFAGTVVSGSVRPGDEVVIVPSGRRSRVARIVTEDGDLELARAGQAVTLTLSEQVDTSRGDVIAAVATPPQVTDQLQATIVWMHDEPLLRGRSYVMRIGSQTVAATIAPVKYRLNVDSLEHMAATKLERGEIGVCDLELSRPVVFDPYARIRGTGAFILIDRITDDTVGAGMIHFALRRADNVRWQQLTVDGAARAASKHQTPCVLWFTGLSGAGKSSIANRVEVELHGRGQHTYVLDGDNVRHGLNRDLGFTDADRVENIRRVAEVAKLMVDAGLIVLVSFISPFRSERQMARALFEQSQFFEVFVDTPLAVAEERDPKGLYKKARSGELQHFTGIDSPYEPPEDPELRLDTAALSAPAAAAAVIELLERRDLLPPA